MSNYVIFIDDQFPNLRLTFMNKETEEIVLDQEFFCEDPSDVPVYMRGMFHQIQSGLPKGHTIRCEIVQVEQPVA